MLICYAIRGHPHQQHIHISNRQFCDPSSSFSLCVFIVEITEKLLMENLTRAAFMKHFSFRDHAMLVLGSPSSLSAIHETDIHHFVIALLNLLKTNDFKRKVPAVLGQANIAFAVASDDSSGSDMSTGAD